jgi:hypothetical protein
VNVNLSTGRITTENVAMATGILGSSGRLRAPVANGVYGDLCGGVRRLKGPISPARNAFLMAFRF